MITKTKDFLSKNNIPAFIKNNKALLKTKNIYKIFPSIGLPNSKETIIIDNTIQIENITKELAKLILNNFQAIHDNHNYYSNYSHYEHKMKSYDDTIFVMKAIYADINNGILSNKKGKDLLKLNSDILSNTGQTAFREGQSLFKVYNKIKLSLDGLIDNQTNLILYRIEDFELFKQYSSLNISNELDIVFSSDGVEGLWDIATMSARGIQSCQSWTGSHKIDLIGSIIDPFTAIIYLTGNTETKNGSKMIRRSVVRFVVDKKTKEKAILIDRMYPSYDEPSETAFISFIKKRVEGQNISVISNAKFTDNGGLVNKYYIPNADIHDNLNFYSYRDTIVKYKEEIIEYDHKYDDILNKILSKVDDFYYSQYSLLFDSIIKLIKTQHSNLSDEHLKRLIAIYFISDKNKLVSKRRKYTISYMKKYYEYNRSTDDVKNDISSINKLLKEYFISDWKSIIQKEKLQSNKSPLPN